MNDEANGIVRGRSPLQLSIELDAANKRIDLIEARLEDLETRPEPGLDVIKTRLDRLETPPKQERPTRNEKKG